MTHRCNKRHDLLVNSFPRAEQNRLFDCYNIPDFKNNFFGFLRCSSFFPTKFQAWMTMYPNMETTAKCTLMLMANLAEPEWLPVNCWQELVNDVLCETRPRDQLAAPVSGMNSTILSCPPSSIRTDNMCFLFMWLSSKSPNISSISNLCKHKKVNPVGVKIVKSFQHIFDAVSASFPPILFLVETNSSHIYKVKYVRILNLFEYKQDIIPGTDVEGYHMCFFAQRQNNHGSNIFQCRDGTYKSSTTVCDVGVDCLNVTTFETHCLCKNFSQNNHCLNENNGKGRACSPLQYLGKNGLCHTFLKKIVKISKEDFQKESFRCMFSGYNLDYGLLDDLVADCGTKSEDELSLQILLRIHFVLSCKNPGEIPCRQGHSKCYKTTDICVYKLDKFGHLSQCRNGGHLEQCKNFQCNMMFKCPNSYCVPWSYVHDGKWDCAFGEDEIKNDTSGINSHCKFLYKCINATQCVHLGSTCDNEENCPFGDDELLCELEIVLCPIYCQCLTYAMNCHYVAKQINRKQTFAVYPHLSVTISCATALNVKDLFLAFPAVMFASLAHNNIHEICRKRISSTVLYLDVSFNVISAIVNNCLNITSLKTLNIRDNHIVTLEQKSFSNLRDLQVLCLSNNPFLHLPIQLLADSTRLKFLGMKNVTSTNFDTKALNGLMTVILDVTDYHLCCVASSVGNCTSAVPWFFSCTDLLHDTKIEIMYIFMSVLVLALNVLSVWLHVVTCESTKAFMSEVVSVNLSNLVVCFYLCVIWSAEVYYSGTFVLKEELWRSSTWCFTAFCFILFFTLLSQFFLLFLSLSRMMVVVYPMDTRFKRTKFVIRSLCAFTSTSLLVCVPITVTVKLTLGYLPTPVCSPFFDPANNAAIFPLLIWSVSISQLVSAAAIVVFHVLLVQNLHKSQRKLRKSNSQDTKSSLVVQLVVITISNISCWFSANTVYILTMFVGKYPTELILWTTVSSLPFNSVLIPAVFVGTSIRKYVTTVVYMSEAPVVM